jgi:hypothetical protein
MTCFRRQGEAGDDEDSSNPFATPMSKGTGCSTPRSGYFTPGKATVRIVHETELARDRCGRAWKISLAPGFEHRTVQPVKETQYRPSYTGSLAPKYCCLFPAPSDRMGGTRCLGEALRYKPEGHGFDFRWGKWFFIDLILPAALCP